MINILGEQNDLVKCVCIITSKNNFARTNDTFNLKIKKIIKLKTVITAFID